MPLMIVYIIVESTDYFSQFIYKLFSLSNGGKAHHTFQDDFGIW